MPAFYINGKVKAQAKRMEKELPMALQRIATNIRIYPDVAETLTAVAETLEDDSPLAAEFRRTARDLRSHGVQALADMENRAAVSSPSLATVAFQLQRYAQRGSGSFSEAFTGAAEQKPGMLELADQGTLFLDEIGDMPVEMQAKLLRALQEQEVWRVGATAPVKIDMRVIAATHKDIKTRRKQLNFRDDLYYRLANVEITAPSLRERTEDIAPLAEHFLERTCMDLGRDPMRLSKQQVKQLVSHSWPGNIRELRNVIERAVILSTGNRARLDLALSDSSEPASEQIAMTPQAEDLSFVTDAEMREREKANLISALNHVDGRVWGPDGAAVLLGIKPSTLAYRMKVLGI